MRAAEAGAPRGDDDRSGAPGPVLADSITALGERHRGTVVVTGSHGGAYCGYLAARAGLRGVVLNDAGVGRDMAGIRSLVYLDRLDLAAATVDTATARIGDAGDMLARGIVSHVNRPAARIGCRPGDACAAVAEAFAERVPYRGEPDPYPEARRLLAPGPPAVWACDSASLVEAADAGGVVVTGSHGGVLAGRPDYGVRAPVLAALFNDAGVGVDEAGTRRLAVLERQGIAAATVSAETARIGDAASTWDDGVVSHANAPAVERGAAPGLTARAWVGAILGRAVDGGER